MRNIKAFNEDFMVEPENILPDSIPLKQVDTYKSGLEDFTSDLFGVPTGTLIAIKFEYSNDHLTYYSIVNTSTSGAKRAFVDSFPTIKLDNVDMPWVKLINYCLSGSDPDSDMVQESAELVGIIEEIDTPILKPYFDSFDALPDNLPYFRRKFNYPFSDPEDLIRKMKETFIY
jgi:hypothetical protein